MTEKVEKADKQEQIFDAALKLFNEVGFEKTPTALIAREAGVAVGTLFHHFPTKEDLVNALFLKCKGSFYRQLSQGMDGKSSFHGRIQLMFLQSVTWAAEQPQQYRFIIQYHQSRHIREGTLETARLQFEPLIQLVLEGVTADTIKPLSVDLLASIAWNIIMAAAQHVMDTPELLQDNAFMDSAFQVLWDALRR